jgi:hypothetical protein
MNMDRETRKKYWKCFREMSCDELEMLSEEIRVEIPKLEERRTNYGKKKERIDKLLETYPSPLYCRKDRYNNIKLYINKLESEISEIVSQDVV